LADNKPMHEGIGGKSALISIDDTPILVKKVPLTDLEYLDQNFMSTANLLIYHLAINMAWALLALEHGVS